MLDILIVGGQYPDFKEYCMKRGSIGIKDGKIAYIGDGEPDAEEVINAEGKIVSPGFIDIHMHEEDFHEGEKYVIADMMLEMGVTTAVGGNCGIQNQNLSEFKNTIARLGGSPVNYLMFAGYNTFRYELGIERYAEATKTEQAEIRRLLKRELSEGACGISFGIEYDPGMTFDEIMYACGATCDPRLLVSAHYRDDGKYETFTGTVENGQVSIDVDSFSPFVIALADDGSEGGSTVPTTGVSDDPGSMAVVMIFAAALGMAVFLKRRAFTR